MANEKPNATVDQLIALLKDGAPALESGGASARKNELMQKSMSGAISREENEELAKIVTNETGLAGQMARVFASEALQKSLNGVAGETLRPIAEAQQKSSQMAAEVIATAVTNLQADLARFTKPMGQTQVLQSRMLVEQNALIKSLVSRLEALEKTPAAPPKGFMTANPAGAQAPQASQAPQGAAPTGPRPERLSKSVMSEALFGIYQEASAGKSLPYGLGATQIRDAIVQVDLDQPLQPAVVQAVVDRVNKK